MQTFRLVWFASAALMAWTGVGCFVGIIRFRYFPLIILGTGYLAWGGALLLLDRGFTAQNPTLQQHYVTLDCVLLAVGAVCIFGYRLIYYRKMKDLGITPRRLFGFGAN